MERVDRSLEAIDRVVNTHGQVQRLIREQKDGWFDKIGLSTGVRKRDENDCHVTQERGIK